MSEITDRIPLMSPADVTLIHDKSVELLRDTGFRFAESDEAVAIFKKNGFKTDGDVVFFDEEKIRKCLATVPSSFTVRALNPDNNFELGGGKFAFSNNAAPAYVYDSDRNRRFAVKDDFINFLKIVTGTDEIDLIRPFFDVTDKPDDEFGWHIRWALEYADRAVSGSSQLEVELTGMAFGKTVEQMRREAQDGYSHIVGICSPRSPLAVEPGNVGFMMALARSGGTCKISPMPIGGMTGPITLPGLLVLENAEVLACTCLLQLVNPGSPVIYGALATTADMKTTVAATAPPEYSGFLVRGAAAMAAYYDFPARIDGAHTDACGLDFQAGAESAILYTNILRSGGNMIAGAGALESKNMSSLEKLVLDMELIRYAKKMVAPVEISEETLALDLIKENARDAMYIMSEHTMNHFREGYDPELFQRLAYPIWEERGGRDSFDVAKKKVKELLEGYQKPDILPPSVLKDMDKLLEKK